MKNVTVVVPEIKLALEDLAYLRSLQTNQTSCIPSNKARNKLLFLGLIEQAEIEPAGRELLEFHKSRLSWVEEIARAAEVPDWNRVNKAARELAYLHEPQSKKGIVLTDAGKRILSHGKAETAMSKKGCL